MVRRRPLAAFFTLIALVTAQFLVSAHACDRPFQGRASEVVAHSAHCPGVSQDDSTPDNLCEQHCQYGDASVESNAPAPVAMHVAGPALRLEPAGTLPTEAISPSRADVPPIAAPPPAILFGVLRI